MDILDQKGETKQTEVGTPQGSVMSPILANIFLHHALDTWFLENWANQEAVIVRYADDAVFMFSKEQKAKDFLSALRLRLAEYKLSVNEDKTAFWNKLKGWNKINLVIKTQREKLEKKNQEFNDWIKLNRSRLNRKEIWSITTAKLRGHYNYYGYFCNYGKLMLYYKHVIGSLFRWLNKRSQKTSYTWSQFKRLLSREPLPLPPTRTKLKQLGWSPYVN